jgi:hypothetical protein
MISPLVRELAALEAGVALAKFVALAGVKTGSAALKGQVPVAERPTGAVAEFVALLAVKTGAEAATGVLTAVEAGSRLTKKLSDVEAGAAAALKGQVPVAERPRGAVAKCVLTAVAGFAAGGL